MVGRAELLLDLRRAGTQICATASCTSQRRRCFKRKGTRRRTRAASAVFQPRPLLFQINSSALPPARMGECEYEQ